MARAADMNTSPRIVILDGATLNPGDNPWTELETLGDVEVFDDSTPEQAVARLSSADIAVTNKVTLSADLLKQLPDLKFIAVTATGHDCVDSSAAHRLGIPVSNVPTYGTDSVSQFAMAQLLELCHRIAQHDSAVRAGHWQKSGAFSFWLTPQVELAGLTMGIIGFGRIGRRTGVLASAFGMRVLAADTAHQQPPDYEGFEWADLDRISTEADVVTLHCNLTDETQGIISDRFLSRMKPTAFLINASRGPLVDESALAAALNAGRVAGAATDVACSEPIAADSPLLSARNLLITPHMAWSTRAARKRMTATTAANVRAFLAGTPENTVHS
ncbi:MAG: D-2-hydroxyacid dehydrogenase [Planctomycetaceae bacterium]